MGRAFGEAIFLGELMADKVVHARVVGPEFEGGFAGGFLLVWLVLEMGQDGAIGPGVGMPGVYFFDAVEKFCGGGVIFGIQLAFGEEQKATDVIAVAFEGGIQRLHREVGVAGFVGLGEAV